MKIKLTFSLGLLISALCLTASAQGTAFTYQGRLNDGSSPASGIYDLRFAIYDLANAGAQQGNTLTNSAIAVSNGLFSVTLDFGNQFPGPDRWLEIGVRTNSSGAFATLSPRQPLTAAPYAIYAGSSATLATTNSQPLNLTINGTNVLHIESVYDSGSSSYTVNSVGGYSGNVISNGLVGAFIGGGGNSSSPNRVGANYASVLGGMANIASGAFSTAMGVGARASGAFSTAMGGNTTASGPSSTSMGQDTTASGLASTAMGNFSSADGTASTAMGNYSSADGYAATALGNSTAASGNSAIAMGYFARAIGNYSTAMGGGTTASEVYSTATGFGSIASGVASTAMGNLTTASNSYSLAAGSQTIAGGLASTAMGASTTASGDYSTALGDSATASSDHTLAAGLGAVAKYPGVFVWADTSYSSFDPFSQPGPQGVPNSFNVRSTGGFYIVSGVNPANGSITSGVQLNAGSGTWASYSDRNSKTNFQPVNTSEVLEKLVRVPLETWNYKAQSEHIRHLGPMAQDFAAAFGVGEDDTHITTVDADGVALAAIQGLNQKVEAGRQRSEVRIQKLEAENAALKQRLEKLEHLLTLK